MIYFITLLASLSLNALNFADHDDEIALPSSIHHLTVHRECNCSPPPPEHACGSYALMHALWLEMRHGLRPMGYPLKELNNAFKELGINNTFKDHCKAINIKNTAHHLGLKYYFIQPTNKRICDLDPKKILFTEEDAQKFQHDLIKIHNELCTSKNRKNIYHFFICFRTPYENSFEPHVILMSVVKNNNTITAQIFDNLNWRIESYDRNFSAIKVISDMVRNADKTIKLLRRNKKGRLKKPLKISPQE